MLYSSSQAAQSLTWPQKDLPLCDLCPLSGLTACFKLLLQVESFWSWRVCKEDGKKSVLLLWGQERRLPFLKHKKFSKFCTHAHWNYKFWPHPSWDWVKKLNHKTKYLAMLPPQERPSLRRKKALLIELSQVWLAPCHLCMSKLVNLSFESWRSWFHTPGLDALMMQQPCPWSSHTIQSEYYSTSTCIPCTFLTNIPASFCFTLWVMATVFLLSSAGLSPWDS